MESIRKYYKPLQFLIGMAEVGDKVKITTRKGSEEGVLMPSHEKKIMILKLSNGYNIGFEKKEIKSIVVVKKKKSSSTQPKKISQKKSLPTIAILNCGGTIASKVDYETGGVVAKFSADDLMEMFPEIRKIANIKAVTVAQMMSEDMMFSDYQKIAEAIKKQNKVEGIILAQGTDTLGYTAAALSFMLEEVNIPVLVVGSQRSTDRGSSDAFQNLICAAQFIAGSDFVGVGVCMHSSSNDGKCVILPGARTRKIHTTRRDAFKAINGQPVALVDLKTGKVEFKTKKYRKSGSGLVVKSKFEDKVGLLKTHVNMNPKLFEFYADNFKGIIIEGTGLGHAPTNLGKDNLRNYEILKKFIGKGGVVGITSQCIFGAVNPNVYTNLRRLFEIGCVFCEDMVPETAFIKLAWLLGNYPKEAEQLLGKNLRGEISKRLVYEKDYLKR